MSKADPHSVMWVGFIQSVENPEKKGLRCPPKEGLLRWLSSKKVCLQCKKQRRHSSIPGLGRYPVGENSNALQYSCLENPMDRGALQATVHRVAKTWTQLSDWAHTSPKVKGICLETVFVLKLQIQPFPGSPGWPTCRIQSYEPLQSHEPVP